MTEFFKILRPGQWIKNFLVFLPMIAGNSYNQFQIVNSFIAFIIFIIASSVVYIFNDLIDCENDKLHPVKKNRPLPSGKINKSSLILLGIFFLIMLISLSFLFNTFKVIIFYLFLNIAYTFILKKYKYFDLITLVSFYLLRIYLGAEVNNINVSNYFWIFSGVTFFFLSVLKRNNELIKYNGRFGIYANKDKFLFNILLKISSISSCILLFFYFGLENTKNLYSFHQLLYLLIPIFYYLMHHLKINSLSGSLTDDPIIFIRSDIKCVKLTAAIFAIFILSQFLSL